MNIGSVAMKIRVTQEDLENGNPADAETCPVALAIKRAMPGADVLVDGNQVEFRTGEQSIIGDDIVRGISLPNHIRNWIGRYDMNPEEAEPVEFDLDLEPIEPKIHTLS